MNTTPDVLAVLRQPMRPRSIKVSDQLWNDATQVAAELNTNVAQLCRDHLTAVVKRHRSTSPEE